MFVKMHYNSGYIKHRNRKIPIIWDGQHAQHVAQNYYNQNGSHPYLHVKVQQLAKRVKKWEKVKSTNRRYFGFVKPTKNTRVLVLVEISNNFASIITCYKQ